MQPIKIPLWRRAQDISLMLYPTESSTPRGAIMVIPGSGYYRLADHEGGPVAERLAREGFDAAVLHHRVAPDRHPAMIHDAQRGMRLMKNHSAIRALSFGVLGFSAGGHLASILSVHHDRFRCHDDDLADTVSARPDAVALGYPVIDMIGPATHLGSRDCLLGESLDRDDLELLSSHRHVKHDGPPAFIWHGQRDTMVPLENALLFTRACRDAEVPFDLHTYAQAGHGLGLAEDQPDVARWFDDCVLFFDRYLNA